MKIRSVLLSILTLISGAAGGQAAGETGTGDLPPLRYEILFLGNSHSAVNDLPGLLGMLIEAGVPGSTADTALAPGYGFLDERLNDGVSLKLLNSRTWTHVVLQAQKYSTSGLYNYPTEAAEEWIRRVKAVNAAPILFPEWPRRGNTEEGPRVQQLHLDIASREAACVAPIGLSWEESIARNPGLQLHAADGNHSNPTGALLTAYVLYEVITGRSALNIPAPSLSGISVEIQQELAAIAHLVVGENQVGCFAKSVTFNVPALNRWGLILMVLLMAGLGLLFR